MRQNFFHSVSLANVRKVHAQRFRVIEIRNQGMRTRNSDLSSNQKYGSQDLPILTGSIDQPADRAVKSREIWFLTHEKTGIEKKNFIVEEMNDSNISYRQA